MVTPRRSFDGSKGNLLYTDAVIASAPTSHSNRVWPSGADLATWSAPGLPLAPGLFSTMTVCFRASGRGWLMTRAMMSDEPPGGYGTMILIGLLGQACAPACRATHNSAANVSIFFMAFLGWVQRNMRRRLGSRRGVLIYSPMARGSHSDSGGT